MRGFKSLLLRHFFIYAQIAQSVEQRTENPRVGGSIPPLGTIDKPVRLKEHPPWKVVRSTKQFVWRPEKTLHGVVAGLYGRESVMRLL